MSGDTPMFDSLLEREFFEIASANKIELVRGPRALPGKPDFQVRGTRTLIFLHGCYWHRHRCAKGSRVPRTNLTHWNSVFSRQVRRDDNVLYKLKARGWTVNVIWECEVQSLREESLLAKISIQESDLTPRLVE